jgi:2-polyprenyl-6-methoxyphenol hydroxylase-like FAD-dependent oxidoreductase
MRGSRRFWRHAWRAWVRFWVMPEPEPAVRCPPCLPNLFTHHPLHHETVRVVAVDQDEALSVIAGGVV